MMLSIRENGHDLVVGIINGKSYYVYRINPDPQIGAQSLSTGEFNTGLEGIMEKLKEQFCLYKFEVFGEGKVFLEGDSRYDSLKKILEEQAAYS